MKSINLIYFGLLMLVFSNCTVLKKYKHTNALIKEKSPYLLQHAHNPVDWKAWNETNTKIAKKQDKLLIISIGYAACHWCHVMEKESFEDDSVAKMMNQNFNNFKIDREERPDIDQIYMTACQFSRENGCGWPLNVIALPNGSPIFVSSYLSKEDWYEKLNYYFEAYTKSPNLITNYAGMIVETINENQNKINLKTEKNDSPSISIQQKLDSENGGIKEEQKFPRAALFNALFELDRKNNVFNTNIELTLNKMANGGIYDCLEGGFGRYSLDKAWGVPHFEKMLIDNAQLISLYSKAFHRFRNQKYKQTAIETITYLENNFRAKSGGFYSATDADIDGVEGEFYVWRKTEIDSVLKEDAAVFCNYFSITKEGNWENGLNILRVNPEFQHYDIDIENFKLKVLAARNQRVKPKLDTKIIASSNALMLKAYLDAYRFLDDEKYLKSAIELAKFIERKLINKNGEVKHLIYSDENDFLEDYAFLMEAYIELYQLSFEKKWLDLSNQLAATVIKKFEKENEKLFRSSARNTLFVASEIPFYDAILPSSNAVFASVLFDLGIIFQNKKYTEKAKNMLETIMNLNESKDEINFYYWLLLKEKFHNKPLEISIVGKSAKTVLKSLKSENSIILMGSVKEENLPLLENKTKKGKTMIYVCQNNICQLPTENVAEVIELLKKY